MRTRAKFTCVGVTKRRGWGEHAFVYEAELQAVTRTDVAPTRDSAEENARFWAATPAGTIKLSTLAADHFAVGATYFVDFTPADVEPT